MQGVFDTGLLLFHLDLGAGADLDHGDAAGELGYPLLQLFAVIVGGGFLDLLADLGDPALDVLRFAGAVDDRGVFLAHLYALGRAEAVDFRAFEAETDLFGDHRAAGKNRDVFQHGLAAVAESRRLHRCDLDDAAHVVDHESRQRFAFDVFGDHEQRTAGLGHPFEQAEHVADIGNLLVDEEDHGIFELGAHGVLIVDEIRGKIAAVELHAFHHVELVFQPGTVFHGNHAFLADLFHRFGDDLADLLVGVRGNRAHLGDRGGVIAIRREFAEFVDDSDYGLVDAALEIHWIHAGGD